MKAGFFNILSYIILIILIIHGMTPGMASARDENPGDDGYSNTDTWGDSVYTENENPHTDTWGDSIQNTENENPYTDTWGDSIQNTEKENPHTDTWGDSIQDIENENPHKYTRDSVQDKENENPHKYTRDSVQDKENENSKTGSYIRDSNSRNQNSGSDNVNSGSENSDTTGSDTAISDNSGVGKSNTRDSDTVTPDSGKKRKNRSLTSTSSSSSSSNLSSSDSSSSNSSSSSDSSSSNSTSSSDSSFSNSSSSNSSSSNSSSLKGSSSDSNSGIDLISREPASNVAVKELSTRSVMGGYPVKYDFVENVTCITHIEFDPKQTFRKTTTSVEELKNKSTLVPKLPSGRIYKYVNLWVGNKGAGDPDSIENGFIEFKVEKSWIKKENINESLIALQWYNENWQSLDTEKVREDKNYVYFKAETPGYSSFAITEYAGQNGDLKSLEEEIKAALKGDAGKGNSRIKNPIGAARIVMAISLPLFMIAVGYGVLKKKI